MKKILQVIFACTLCLLLASCYIPKTGLYENELGTRYYINDVYQTGWQEIDSKTYYFSKVDGYMVTKSQKIGGVFYGFNSDGTLADGFLLDDDGMRYYNDGIYLTKWQEIQGKTYYFYYDTGLMAVGDVTIGGQSYTFAEDGHLLEAESGDQS